MNKNDIKPNPFYEKSDTKSKSDTLEIPSLELPKGGGAVRDTDETFKVNTVNATSAINIPLPFSKARGVTPTLTLNYNSNSRNSEFGLGWNISANSIKRSISKKLPEYLDDIDSDDFLFAESEELVKLFAKDNSGNYIIEPDGNFTYKHNNSSDGNYDIYYYAPRLEGIFARIEKWIHKTSKIISWRVISGDNVTSLLGWTENSRVSDPDDPKKIFEWKLEFVFDDKGNSAHYIHKSEDKIGIDESSIISKNKFSSGNINYTNKYLEKICYGNKTPYREFGTAFNDLDDYLFEVNFDFGNYDKNTNLEIPNSWKVRQDPFSVYNPGFEIRNSRLVERVLFFHNFSELGGKTLVKSIDLTYEQSLNVSLLTSYKRTGYIKKPDNTYSSLSFPPFEFEYSSYIPDPTVNEINTVDLIGSPQAINSPYKFVDLYSEGLSGILYESNNAWYYKHNLGNAHFSLPTLIAEKPNILGLGSKLQIIDLDANGTKQIVNIDRQLPGYFDLDSKNSFHEFVNFENNVNFEYNSQDLIQIDINGDGKPDLLLSDENVFTVFKSLGKKGFDEYFNSLQGDQRITFKSVNALDETIFIADMNGDGLSDIVKVGNGRVGYFANMGYGKFSKFIQLQNTDSTFDNVELFDSKRVKIADIDGDGYADVIYFSKQNISVYKNNAGNSLSTPTTYSPTFDINNIDDIQVVDLLGMGLPSIVNSPIINQKVGANYINIGGLTKPYLLQKYSNNLGKVVELEYTTSTKYFLEDKLADTPWVTKLPFVVYTVSKLTQTDIPTKHIYTNSYKYSNGYFDPSTREFRGFGKCIVQTSENFESFKKLNSSNIVEADLMQSPFRKIIWQDLGIPRFGITSDDDYTESIKETFWDKELAKRNILITSLETKLKTKELRVNQHLTAANLEKLTSDDWIDIGRATKGNIVRTETFALDRVDDSIPEIKKELSPITVHSSSSSIEFVQPKGQNRYPILITKESETITYRYDRIMDDPRIQHDINLKLNEYGQILEKVSIVYPRILVDTLAHIETQTTQSKTSIILEQNSYTNDIDLVNDYRLRLSAESIGYELKGVPKIGSIYARADFENILTTATEISYNDKLATPPVGTTTKRELEHKINTYYSNTFDSELALNVIEEKSSIFEVYQLAFNPNEVSEIYGTKVNDLLLSSAKYVHFNGDTKWWRKSGHTIFRKTGENLNTVKSRFYMPVSFIDGFGNITEISYLSSTFLLVSKVINSIGTTHEVSKYNFRTLSPEIFKDENDNISEIIFDEVGLVKAHALRGKADEADDLVGLTEITTPAEQLLIQNYFNSTTSTQLQSNAKLLIKNSTTRYVHDIFSFKNSLGTSPTVISKIDREEHSKTSPDPIVQLSFEYSNGNGKVIMTKRQAEPGIAKSVTVNPDNSFILTTTDTSLLTPKQIRFVGEGKTILNNKGNPVMQYEPYFSLTHKFEDNKLLVETGVTPKIFYDSENRISRQTNPNGTFTKFQYHPWKKIEFDENDNLMDSDWYNSRKNNLLDAEFALVGKNSIFEKEAAIQSEPHNNTPTIIYFDTRANSVEQIRHNKISGVDEFIKTRVKFDVNGNPLEIIDPRNIKIQESKIDRIGNLCFQQSPETGKRWIFSDIESKTIKTWDERNQEFSFEYDQLQRVIKKKVKGGDGASVLDHTYELLIYGEGILNAKGNNLIGKVYKYYDTSGLTTFSKYDFKKNIIQSIYKLRTDYKNVSNWSDNLALNDSQLELEVFNSSFKYDALNRVTNEINPDGTEKKHIFNEGKLLSKILIVQDGAETEFVNSISYNEKGQRQVIIYGNKAVTTYKYDKENFRLFSITTKKNNGNILQDLRYTFDAAGNVTHMHDLAIPTVFFNNAMIESVNKYTYDPIYRLTSSTGREHLSESQFDQFDNWNDFKFAKEYNPGDPIAFQTYTENYIYDVNSNILSLEHTSPSLGWIRNYSYSLTNNKLLSTQVGVNTYNYSYHAQHGFCTSLPHLSSLVWNFKEELVQTSKQVVLNGGVAETTYYTYGVDGKRVRKITETQSAPGDTPHKKNERIYLGSVEIYREFEINNSITLQRNTFNVKDDKGKFAMIEKRTLGTDLFEDKLVRYQIANHLGSCSLEINDEVDCKIITYELFHPYGTTAHLARNKSIQSTAKRYRFSGMERDEESGLNYHNARYYCMWIGRWINADPIGIKDSLNLFEFSHSNPIKYSDTSGYDGWDRFCGGLRMVGGVLETVAGAGMFAAGVATSEIGVGIPIAIGGGVVTLHGVDTTVAGFRQMWNGEHVDSLTSTGLQAAGMSPGAANLADAGISIVGTLGAGAVTRAPAVVSAVRVTEEGVTTAASPSVTLALRPALGPGHNYVGVTTADGVTTWSHLAVDGATTTSGVTTGGTAVVETLEVVDMTHRLARSVTVTVPVSAASAENALITVVRIAGPEGAQAVGEYNLLTNSCSTYAATVLGAAGVSTPAVTSPTINFVSAALQSSEVMTPIVNMSLAANTTYLATQAAPLLISDANACEMPASPPPEEQVCVAPEPVVSHPPVSTHHSSPPAVSFSPVADGGTCEPPDPSTMVCEAPPAYESTMDYSSMTSHE